MNSTYSETLSAFMDGEAVDPATLAAALEDGAAREALVDFARLRHAAQAASPALPSSLARRQGHAASRIAALRWFAAAALLVLAFLAGLLTPLPTRGSRSSDVPPQPSRTERFEPGVDWHETN